MGNLFLAFKPWEVTVIDYTDRFFSFIDDLILELDFLIPYESIFVFGILGLSALLLIFHLLWYRFDKYLGFVHVTSMVLLAVVSLLELVYVLTFFGTTKSFFDGNAIGTGMMILNLAIFMILIVNQILVYYQMVQNLPIKYEQEDLRKTVLIFWPMSIGLFYLFEAVYKPGVGITIACVILLQLGFFMGLFPGASYAKKAYQAPLHFLLYLVCSLALLAMIIDFLVYIIAVILIGFILLWLLFMAKEAVTSDRVSFSFPAEKIRESCPHCGIGYFMGTPQCACLNKIATGTFYDR